MKCYIINLDKDVERLKETYDTLVAYKFLDVERIAAVKGGALPDIACSVLTDNPRMVRQKGALGVSLSHSFAWEMLLNSRSDFALVFEDDCRAFNLELLENWRMPDDVDLVFCNSRTSYANDGPILFDFLPALDFIAKNRTAVGADGYIISKGGAAKLLSYFAKDKFYSHLDLRMSAYGLRKQDLAALSALSQSYYIIKDICICRRIFDMSHFLNTKVFGVPLTRHVAHGPSSRVAEDKLKW
jgi:GR25 family glycosyltransferase involved in LPS biosynthesis